MSNASPEMAQRIAQAYGWHRALGARVVEAPHCRFVVDASKPGVWDCNHAQAVTASAPHEIDAVFDAMERHYAHTRWRVVHTEGATPDTFVARLAFADYQSRFVTIQMALEGRAHFPGPPPADLRAVETTAQWTALTTLVLENHAEGLTSGGLALGRDFSLAVVDGYRAKSGAFRFHLVYEGGEAVAYAASAVAPNGLGMIEDVFTSRARRRRGVGSALIGALADRLRAQGCGVVFLGALADEQAKGFYARLGFRPVSLARTWVKAQG